MTAEKHRDVLHNIIGEYHLYHGNKDQQFMFVLGYLNCFSECIIWDESMTCDDEGYRHLTRECDYVRDCITGWIKEGSDMLTEINRIGWNTREMENEWWYRHEQS